MSLPDVLSLSERGRCLNGHYAAGRRAGVSAKTVSRVITTPYSPDLRRRVERAIEDLQYVPNLLARTFRYGRDAAIGIAVPDISDPFFSAVIHAVEEIARDRGVALFVTSVGTDGTYEQIGCRGAPRPADRRPDFNARRSRSVVPHAMASRTAIVFIDRAPSNITADTVVEDDHGGGYAATAHLIEHGHRRIGFIGDSSSIATTAGRLDGITLRSQMLGSTRTAIRQPGAMSSRERPKRHGIAQPARRPDCTFLLQCQVLDRRRARPPGERSYRYRSGRLRRLPARISPATGAHCH